MREQLSKSDSLYEKNAREIKMIEKEISVLEQKIIEFSYKEGLVREKLQEMEVALAKYEININLSELENINLKELKKELEIIEKKISSIGNVNLLALQEYENLRKRYEEYLKQIEDIKQTEEGIIKLLETSSEYSLQSFLSTFSKVRENFKDIIKEVFQGGKGDILLEEGKSPMEAGIIIKVAPSGKRMLNLNLLSGGEKTMCAISLLFSLYKVKPSPFYLMDEVDAALDDENIRRFLHLLKLFSNSAQFIIITHNKYTISFADTIYGITMNTPGVSSVYSVKLAKKKYVNA